MRVSLSLSEDLLSVNLLSLAPQSAEHLKFSATSHSDVFRCFSHAAVSSHCLYLCCISYTLYLTLFCILHAAVSSHCLYLCCISHTLYLTICCILQAAVSHTQLYLALCCHQSPSPYLMLQDTQYLLTRQSLTTNRPNPPTSLFATDGTSRGSTTTAGRSQRAKQQCDGNTSVDRASDCFDKEVRESTSFSS